MVATMEIRFPKITNKKKIKSILDLSAQDDKYAVRESSHLTHQPASLYNHVTCNNCNNCNNNFFMHRISVVLCHLLTKPAQVTVQPGSLQQLQQRQHLPVTNPCDSSSLTVQSCPRHRTSRCISTITTTTTSSRLESV